MTTETTPIFIDDVETFGQIQNWSWRRRKKLPDGSPDFGTVAEAAKHFNIDPAYIANLIGRCGSDAGSPYFFWEGPDDDFSKMRFDHDGE
jgi:hypothetical protein